MSNLPKREYLGKPIPLIGKSNGSFLGVPKFGTVNGAPWPGPRDLPSPTPAIPTMPEDLIPDQYRAWLLDASERAQVPPDMIAVPALVATGSVIGRALGIYPKRYDDWLVVPNIWGAVVGRPGIMKSPAITEGLRPLRRLAQQAAEDFKTQAYAAEADKVMLQARLTEAKAGAQAAVKSKNEADMAISRREVQSLMEQLDAAEQCECRYIVNDATVEALGEILKNNPRGVLLFRDELVGLLKSWDKPGRETDRAFFLECWNGAGEFSTDRIGRGTIHIPSTTVSIVGGMTPGKLAHYTEGALRGGGGDDGLIQRFQLLVWPDTPKDWRNVDRSPDAEAFERAVRVFEALDTLDARTFNAEDGSVPGVRFRPDAQDLFDAWRGDLEARLRDNDVTTPAFDSHLAKYRSLMPSLALIFHVIAALEGGAAGAVSIDAARLAARWCDFLEGHARKVYAPELCGGELAAGYLADRIRAGSIRDGVTVRDIYRNGWKGLATPDAVWAAINVLEPLG